MTYLMYNKVLQKQDQNNIYAIMKTLHHVPKRMSWHKAIVVMTESAHCFHVFMIAHVYICV